MNDLSEIFKNYSPSDIDKAFLIACDNGNLDQIKYLVTSKDLIIPANVHSEDDRGLKLVCANGYLDILQYFFTSDYCKHSFSIEKCGTQSLSNALTAACVNGQLAIVKYLLTSDDIKKNEEIIINEGFCNAAKNGQLEIVKYLLESYRSRMDKFGWSSSMHNEYYYFNALNHACSSCHINVVEYLIQNVENKSSVIPKLSEKIFNTTCFKGNIDIFEYLINSSNITSYHQINVGQSHFELAYGNNNLELTQLILMNNQYNKNIDVHANNDKAFFTIIGNKDFELLNFLIFNYDIKITPHINSILEEFDNDGQIKKLFELREINKQLNKEISLNKEFNKKKLKL
jgi:hypothetical protein